MPTVEEAKRELALRELESRFDPEGSGYDYGTAIRHRLGPDEEGHWPSRVPETGQILKGMSHETIDKTREAERQQFNMIYKGPDGKYYSHPTPIPVIRRRDLPGAWAIDQLIDRDLVPFDVSNEIGRVVGVHESEEMEANAANALVYSVAFGMEPEAVFDSTDAINRHIFGKELSPTAAWRHNEKLLRDTRTWLESLEYAYAKMEVMMAKAFAGKAKMLGEYLSQEKGPRHIENAIDTWLEEKGIELTDWADFMLAGAEDWYLENTDQVLEVTPGVGFRETLRQYIYNPKKLARGLIESGPLMLSGMAGTMAGGPAGGIAAMTMSSMGTTYADSRKEGTDVLPALGEDILGSTVESVIEQWTLGKKLGLAKNAKKIVASGFPKVMWESAKAFFRGTAEEGSQALERNFFRWLFTDRSQLLTEGVGDAAAAGGPMEFAMAGAFQAAGMVVGDPITQEDQVQLLDTIEQAYRASDISEQRKFEVLQVLKRVREDVEAGEYMLEEVEEVAAKAGEELEGAEFKEPEVEKVRIQAAREKVFGDLKEVVRQFNENERAEFFGSDAPIFSAETAEEAEVRRQKQDVANRLHKATKSFLDRIPKPQRIKMMLPSDDELKKLATEVAEDVHGRFISGQVAAGEIRQELYGGMAERLIAAPETPSEPLSGAEAPTGPPVTESAVEDKDGSSLEDLDGTPIPVNEDGTITLYHRTSADNANRIRATGEFISEERGEVFFSSQEKGQAEGYGDAIVAINIDPSKVSLDDAFRGGEVHVSVNNKDISLENIVTPEATQPQAPSRQALIDRAKELSRQDYLTEAEQKELDRIDAQLAPAEEIETEPGVMKLAEMIKEQDVDDRLVIRFVDRAYTMQEAVEEGALTEEEAYQAIKDAGYEGADPADVTAFGSNRKEYVDGVKKGVIELSKGADITTLLEEKAEDWYKSKVETDDKFEGQVKKWRADYEEQTGHRDNQSDLEWFSSRAVEYAVHNKVNRAIGQPLNTLLKRFREWVRQVLDGANRLRKYLRTAKEVKDFEEALKESTLITNPGQMSDGTEVGKVTFQLLHKKPWLDPKYENTEWAQVNKRLWGEVPVIQAFFGPMETKKAPITGTKKLMDVPVPEAIIGKIYEAKKSGLLKKMSDVDYPVEKIIKEQGYKGIQAEEFRNYMNGTKTKKGRTLIRGYREYLDFGTTLSNNGKAGYSVDHSLGTCHPSEQCRECYAAKAYYRLHKILHDIHNTMSMINDPKAFGRKIAEDAGKIDREKMQFLRLHGGGDLNTTESIKAYNELAKNFDRPIHIFSRDHQALAKLKSTQESFFVKMGSLDASLYEEYNNRYGKEFLYNNLRDRGIVNAFLHTDKAELSIIEDLYGNHALGLILSVNHKLHNALPTDLQLASCPCDAGETHYMAQCRRCANASLGCFMAHAANGVDSNGKIWSLMDPKAPELVPVLHYLTEQAVAGARSRIAQDIVSKSLALIGSDIRAVGEGKKKAVVLKHIAHVDGVVYHTKSKRNIDNYKRNLQYIRDRATDGTFALMGGKIHPTIVYSKGKQIPVQSRQARRIIEGSKPTTGKKPTFQLRNTFFLKSERAAEKMPNKMPAADFKNFLLKNGVKKDEMLWTGIDELRGTVTKAQVLEKIHNNDVQLDEIIKGQTGQSLERDLHQINIEENEVIGQQAALANELHIQIENLPEPTRFNIVGSSKGSPRYPQNLSKVVFGAIQNNTHDVEPVYIAINTTRKDLIEALPDFDWAEVEALREKRIDLEDEKFNIQLQMEDSDVQYEGYTLPGRKENYSEILLTLPKIKQTYTSPHWSEWNILAHIRLSERVSGGPYEVKVWRSWSSTMTGRPVIRRFDSIEDANKFIEVKRAGNFYTELVPTGRMLFIEEIQSDWHQQGRRKGYRRSIDAIINEANSIAQKYGMKTLRPSMNVEQEKPDSYIDAILYSLYSQRGEIDIEKSDFERLEELSKEAYVSKRSFVVPDAPFKKTWHELAFKRVLRLAADGGYDLVGWTTGQQQADRYDLSTHLNRVTSAKLVGKQLWDINAWDKNDRRVLSRMGIGPEALVETVGKDLADKIIQSEGHQEWKDLDLKVGGEGMKGFYDQMLPAFAKKYMKKWGVKGVGDAEIVTLPGLVEHSPDATYSEVHAVPVTEQMKISVAEGQPTFQMRPSKELIVPEDIHEGQETYEPEGKKGYGLTKAERKIYGPEFSQLAKWAQIHDEPVGYKQGVADKLIDSRRAINRLRMHEKIRNQNRVDAVNLIFTYVPKEYRGQFVRRAMAVRTQAAAEKFADIIEKWVDEYEFRQVVKQAKALKKKVEKLAKRGEDPYGLLPPALAERVKGLLDYDFSKLTEKKRQRLESREDWVKRMLSTVADGYQNISSEMEKDFKDFEVIPQHNIEELHRLSQQHISEISLEQIKDAITQVEKLMTEHAKKQQSRARRRFEKWHTEKTKAVREVQETKPGRKRAGLVGRIRDAATIDQANMRTLIQMATGKKHDATTKMLFGDLVEGDQKRAKAYKEWVTSWRDEIKRAKITDKDMEALEDMVTVMLGGETIEISRDDLLSVYAYTVADGTMRRLLTTEGLNIKTFRTEGLQGVLGMSLQEYPVDTPSVEELKAIANQVLPAHKKLLDIHFKINHEMQAAAINEVSTELTGAPIARDMRHYPVHRELNRRFSGMKVEQAARAWEMLGRFMPRTGGTQRMNIRPFTQEVMSGLQADSHYYGMTIPMMNARSLLSNKEFVDRMNKSGQGKILKSMATIYDRMLVYGTDLATMDLMFNQFFGQAGKSILSLRLTGAAIQAASIPAAYPVVPRGYFSFSTPSKEDIANLKEQYPELWLRWEGRQFDFALGTLTALNGFNKMIKGKSDITDRMLDHYTWGDQIAIWNIYNAAKKMAEDTKGDLDTIFSRAMETQPQWNSLYRPTLMTDPGVLARGFTMFMSARNAQYNVIAQAIDDYQKGRIPEGEMYKRIAHIGQAGLTVAVIRQIIRRLIQGLGIAAFTLMGLRKPPDEDEIKDILKEVGKKLPQETLFNTLGLNVFGALLGTAVQEGIRASKWKWGAYDVRKTRSGNFAVDLFMDLATTGKEGFEFATDVVTLKKVDKGPYKKDEYAFVDSGKRFMEDVALLAAYRWGLPLSGPMSDIYYPLMKAYKGDKK